jgi:hypothetical protein
MIIFYTQVEAIRFSPYDAKAVGKVVRTRHPDVMFCCQWRMERSIRFFVEKNERGERQLVKKR